MLLPSAPPPISGRTAPPHPLAELGERIRRYLNGEETNFEPRHLELLALESCTHFQQHVLLATYAIPRGQVATYSGIAAQLGKPYAARAVGNALAYNPFPIIIPCHRVVRADGHLGGYGGGPEMKRTLLELEGVRVSPAGIVDTHHAPRNT
ncbi:MAG: methylated-DNA--[protein]-cysteine S-methyltransferase [Anaerolineae bacterium]|nr:methylated-DNA--[protein]-cysteine S-methyltransferase [Anaerolineae bacterium]